MTYRCPRCHQEIAIVNDRIVEHWQPNHERGGSWPSTRQIYIEGWERDGSEPVPIDAWLTCPWSGAKVRLS